MRTAHTTPLTNARESRSWSANSVTCAGRRRVEGSEVERGEVEGGLVEGAKAAHVVTKVVNAQRQDNWSVPFLRKKKAQDELPKHSAA